MNRMKIQKLFLVLFCFSRLFWIFRRKEKTHSKSGKSFFYFFIFEQLRCLCIFRNRLLITSLKAHIHFLNYSILASECHTQGGQAARETDVNAFRIKPFYVFKCNQIDLKWTLSVVDLSSFISLEVKLKRLKWCDGKIFAFFTKTEKVAFYNCISRSSSFSVCEWVCVCALVCQIFPENVYDFECTDGFRCCERKNSYLHYLYQLRSLTTAGQKTIYAAAIEEIFWKNLTY